VAIAAELVLAADGLGGQLLPRTAAQQTRVAVGSRVGAGVIVSDTSGDYEPHTIYMACGTSGYVGLVRLEDGRLNLAAAFDAGFLRACGRPGVAAARVLAEVGWPALSDLADQPWRGTPPLTRWATRPAAPRVLALGDAAGYVEPFTGEGMACALAAAEAVVPLAVRPWHPAVADAWAAWHRRTGPRRQRFIRAAAWVLRRPQLARAAVGLLGSVSGWVDGRLGSSVINHLTTQPPHRPVALPPPSSPARSPAPHTAAAHPAASAAPG
jgi:flavin-dependent dehydrogenase